MEQVESRVIEEERSNPTIKLPGNKVKHLAEMLNCTGNNLGTKQAGQVKDVVMEYSDVFAELGHTILVQHGTDTDNHHAIKQSPQRIPQAQRETADKENEKMLSNGFIEPSDSPWTSPIVLVAKKDGSIRVYLNDIIVFGKCFEEALANLVQVFECLRKACLKLKPSKGSLFQTSVKFLGHVVSKEGIACDLDKIDCVRDWETPKCVTEVHHFVGFASYYRRFIPHIAFIAAALVRLTEKNAKFCLDHSCAEAFNTLEEKLFEAPVLACPQA